MCGILGDWSLNDKSIKRDEFSKILNLSRSRGTDSTQIEIVENIPSEIHAEGT